MGHPERYSAGAFDFHEYHTVRQKRRSVYLGFQRQILLTAKDRIVKTYTEISAVFFEIRFSRIG